VDPLEIIDLRDPRDIRSLGILEIEGFVNRIDVRGKHLIALGNVQNAEGTGTRNLAMHVFDVEDPTMPRQLGVTTVGEGWAWTSSNWDLKSYRIVDDLGLVLMPVSESSTDASGRWNYRQFLQLVSFDFEACDSGDRANCIRTRGSVDGHGEVRRAFPVEDRIVSFSDLSLQVADVSNPDMPALTTTVELAVDIQDYRVVNGAGVMVVGKGDWNNRSAELRIVDAARPDERRATATLALDTPTGTVHTIGSDKILIVASDYTNEVVDGEPRWQSWTILTVVDLSNPARPTVAAQNRIPELGFNRWSRRIWMPAPGPSYAVAEGALVAFTWPREGEAEGGKLRVYDVGDAQETRVIDIGAETVVDMTAVGSTMYVTSYEPVMTAEPPMDPAMLPAGSHDADDDDASAATLLPGSRIWPGRRRNQTVVYKLRVLDLALPTTPTVGEPINVPGQFGGTMQHRDGRTILFTTDMFMHEEAAVTAFDAMTLTPTQVTLDDVFGTPEGAGRVIVQDTRAFFVKNTYGWSGPVPLGDEAAIDRRAPSSTLYALSIAQNTARARGTYRPAVTIRRLGEADLGAGTFNELALVEGNLAFVRGGYGNVLVYDVTHPRTGMTLLGDFRTSAGWWSGAMHFDGSRLFLANGLYGLDVISVR
jgi:hypothetical protein